MARHVQFLLLGVFAAVATAAPAGDLPTPEQVIAAKTDLWADAALARPGGPTYEFFAGLVPPLRYVDADFLHHPLVLSAPGSAAKARLLSNGSAINALARIPVWQNESGTPVLVHVGDDRDAFGSDLAFLDGPHYADGFLPIVQLRYAHKGASYGQEAFAAIESPLAAAAAVCLRFELPTDDRARIDLRFDNGDELYTAKNGRISNKEGKALATYDENWDWVPGRNMLLTKTAHAAAAYVNVFTHPIDPSAAAPASADGYRARRDACEKCWRDLLAAGATFDVPEPYVNNAWRSLLVGTHAILSGDQLNYSASNQYARKYAHESGEALRSLLLFGHAQTAARTIPPLFVYRRRNIEYHDGAFKLRLLADYYFVTRDKELVRNTRPLWQKEIDLILGGRDKSTGLLPREKYCSDIDTRIRSNNANANCWRGLRDMALVLEDVGETEQAQRLSAVAAEYRKQVLAFIDKSTVRTVDPPFVPIAIDGEEPVPSPITATRLGSYWNLVVQSLLGSGVFTYDSQTAADIIRYMQTNGGLCMGMVRVQSARGTWINTQNIDDLYGVRYNLLLLQRDEVDRALVSFYAKLAQGMTRETFYDGESSSIVPLDRFGRQMYLPPNSAANASFLLTFRNLLVQDWDMDDDGKPETLRLLYATPRQWLADGGTIKIKDAPTAFGPLSLTCHAELAAGQITADLTLPSRQPPAKILIRFRLPGGHKITSAAADDHPVRIIDPETLDLSPYHGQVHVRATTAGLHP
jgi:hypothetical protein